MANTETVNKNRGNNTKSCVCGHEMTKHEWKNQWVCHRCGRTKLIQEYMTNADRIRNMTDEDLAEFWEHGCDEVIDCKVCEEPRNEYGSCTGQCRKEYLRWLRKEVER